MIASRWSALAVCAAGLACAALGGVSACSHDWDRYDPRADPGSGGGTSTTTTGGPGGQGGAGSVGGGGGAGGAAGVGGAGGAGAAGGAGGGTCTTAGVIPLMDAFDGDSIDGQWSVDFQNEVAVSQASGHLIVDFAEDPSPRTYGGVYSVNEYNLTDCAVFTSVVTVPDPATHAYVQLVVSTDAGYIEVLEDGDELYFKSYVGNMFTTYDSVPYDPVMHRFWRIREAAGMTYWETSPDAQSWAIGASEPSPIPLSAVYVGVAGGTYQAEPSPPGEIHFDGVNVAP